VAALLPGLARLGIDNSPEAFFVEDARALTRYRRFREFFARDGAASDAAVRMVLTGEGIWTPRGLAWLGRLEEEAAAVPGVAAAMGLAGRWRIELPRWPPEDPEAFRRRAVDDAASRAAGWVGERGEAVAVWVELSSLQPAAQTRLLSRLEALLAAASPGVEGCLVGLPVLQRAMDQAFEDVSFRLFPGLILAAVLLLWAALGRPTDVVLLLAFVGAVLAALFGALGWAGVRLDLVTVILAPLVFVVTLATAVHVLLGFRRAARRTAGPGADPGTRTAAALRALWREKAWPVFWTGATTALAFGSLAASPVPPVRTLGLAVCLGLAGMTLGAFTLLPALLTLRRGPTPEPPPRGFERWGQGRGAVWAAWAVRRRRWVLAGALGVAALAAAGLPRLELGTSLRGYFSPTHPMRRCLERGEERGLGAVSAELVLVRRKGPGTAEDGGFREPAALAKLARLAAELRREPRIFAAAGAGDLLEARLRSMVVAGEVDDDLRWLVLGLTEADPQAARLLHALVTPRGESARVSLLLPLAGFDELEPLFAAAEERARRLFPEAEVWVTGQYPLVLESQRRLLATLLTSLSLTLAVVAVTFLLLLGSPRLAWRALVPNLWPVVLVLGAMGWLGVPVDSTTVIVAAVVLGLAVDDTLHTLGRFRRLTPGRGGAEAVRRTLEGIAPAHLLTTLLLAAGFGVCAFSDFIPVARFGALTAAALVAALVGDLLLLPALLGGGGGLPRPPSGVESPQLRHEVTG
jgi:predicted RND superfamily exporter protein